MIGHNKKENNIIRTHNDENLSNREEENDSKTLIK